MEWENYYMDVMLVPLGLVISVAYHVWLWHKIRTQPYTTILGIDAHGRRFWVPIMMKDIAKNNITAVQAIRNLLMASTLMATTSILLCAGLGAVISSTYSVKKPINDTVFGANGELIVALKYATILAVFILSFTCHTLSIRFLNQINILISTPQDGVNCMVTPEFLTLLLEKASILNVVGNRFFYAGLPLLLWIFGPLMAFLSCLVMLSLLYNLDFVDSNGGKVDDNNNGGTCNMDVRGHSHSHSHPV